MRFPSAAAACLAAALWFPAAGAQAVQAEPGAPGPGRAVRVFEGVSNRGLFQEALDDAVAKALRGRPGTDRLVRYRVREITGEQDGNRGAGVLRVVIELTGDEESFYLEPKPERTAPPVTAPVPVTPRASDPETILQSLEPALQLSAARVDRGDSVSFALTVRNTSDQTVRVPMLSNQRYDFEVWQKDRLVWRLSHGKNPAQTPGLLVFEPGQAITYRAVWNLRNNQGLRVPAGSYVVRGYMRSTTRDGLQLGASADLTVTGR